MLIQIPHPLLTALQLESTKHSREEQRAHDNAGDSHARLRLHAHGSTVVIVVAAIAVAIPRVVAVVVAVVIVVVVIVITAVADDLGARTGRRLNVARGSSVVLAAAEDVLVLGAGVVQTLGQVLGLLVQGETVQAAIVVVADDVGVATARLHVVDVLVLVGHGADGSVLYRGDVEVVALDARGRGSGRGDGGRDGRRHGGRHGGGVVCD